MTEEDPVRAIQRAMAEELGIPKLRRHIFLCCDQSLPKCCDKAKSLQSWSYLKRRLEELGLSPASDPGGPPGRGDVFRTKANCLRICAAGPIAVVYPEGTWYGNCTPDVLEQIIQKHLLGGEVATEHLIVQRRLG